MFENKLYKELRKKGRQDVLVRSGKTLHQGTMQENGRELALVKVRAPEPYEDWQFNLPYHKIETDLQFYGCIRF